MNRLFSLLLLDKLRDFFEKQGIWVDFPGILIFDTPIISINCWQILDAH